MSGDAGLLGLGYIGVALSWSAERSAEFGICQPWPVNSASRDTSTGFFSCFPSPCKIQPSCSTTVFISPDGEKSLKAPRAAGDASDAKYDVSSLRPDTPSATTAGAGGRHMLVKSCLTPQAHRPGRARSRRDWAVLKSSSNDWSMLARPRARKETGQMQDRRCIEQSPQDRQRERDHYRLDRAPTGTRSYLATCLPCGPVEMTTRPSALSPSVSSAYRSAGGRALCPATSRPGRCSSCQDQALTRC
jgi:hypothetical protein